MDLATSYKEIVRALAESAAPLDDETEECLLCDVRMPWDQTTYALSATTGNWYGDGHYDHRAHKTDCPWRRARDLLGVPLNRITPNDRERSPQLPAEQVEHLFLKDGHSLDIPRRRN